MRLTGARYSFTQYLEFKNGINYEDHLRLSYDELQTSQGYLVLPDKNYIRQNENLSLIPVSATQTCFMQQSKKVSGKQKNK